MSAAAVRRWRLALLAMSAVGMSGVACAAAVSAPDAQLSASSADELRRKLAGLLVQQLSTPARQVDVQGVGIWGLGSAAGQEPVQLHIEDVSVRGATAVVTMTQEGRHRPATVVARAQLVAREWVQLITQRVSKGDAMSCALLHGEWRAVAGQQRSWAGTCEVLQGLQARRPLDFGDVLLSSDVGPAPDVKDRDNAIVLSRWGAVEIRAQGMALSDGMVGQVVPVRIAGQTQVVRAKVVAQGVTQVVEGL